MKEWPEGLKGLSATHFLVQHRTRLHVVTVCLASVARCVPGFTHSYRCTLWTAAPFLALGLWHGLQVCRICLLCPFVTCVDLASFAVAAGSVCQSDSLSIHVPCLLRHHLSGWGSSCLGCFWCFFLLVCSGGRRCALRPPPQPPSSATKFALSFLPLSFRLPRKTELLNVDHVSLHRDAHRQQIQHLHYFFPCNVLCLLRQLFLLSVSPAAQGLLLKVSYRIAPATLRFLFTQPQGL